MLFKILKLFGLDVPAKIEAAKSTIELHVERISDRLKAVAEETAIIAALSATAAVFGVMAIGVGLIALYRWTADAYGDYAGLSVVDGLLVAIVALLALVAAVKIHSLAHSSVDNRNHADTSQAVATTQHSREDASLSPTAPTGASASDLVEPLVFFLSKAVKPPTFGNPAAEELIDSLRHRAQGSAEEAIDRAANVIRYGDRLNLALVLTGTAMLAWLLTRGSRR
jgi:hypothetical protein